MPNGRFNSMRLAQEFQVLIFAVNRIIDMMDMMGNREAYNEMVLVHGYVKSVALKLGV